MIGSPLKPLSTETFRLLQEYLYEISGIRLGMDQRLYLENKLIPVCRDLSLESFEDLYSFAQYHPLGKRAREALIEATTTHETYLFRESFQFDLLVHEILEKKRDQLPSRLRVLSAGCSSGEELVSMAICLHEERLDLAYSFDLVGVDISESILQSARNAEYRESSFRASPEHWRHKYFSPGSSNYTWVLNEDLRRSLTYVKMNLLDPFRFRVLGKFHIIFCRNVMIYFDRESKMLLLDLLYRHLEPGGYLFLGHAENLIQLDTGFVAEQFERDIIYTKPEKVE